MLSAPQRLAYAAGSAARVGWYMGQYALSRRRLKPLPRPEAPVGPTPTRAELMRSLRDLFRQDLANVDAGLYPLPADLAPNPARLLRDSLRYFADLPAVDRRRHARAAQEPADDPRFDKLPRYFRQNFHFQTDGWLSERSADLYDTQVETLFSGAADAMRRQGLAPLAELIAEKAARGEDVRALRLVDVGCGAGGFLRQALQARPRLQALGVDLSEPYLGRARREFKRSPTVRLALAGAEALPLADGSVDAVSMVFLLHELPPKIRALAAKEAARVLKPGGRLIVVDSLQRGDRPGWEGLLDLFPHYAHEPYYAGYVASDLGALFGKAGLKPKGESLAFFSKISVFERPR